jgi:ABC-type uncharacterized transport system substrate-binding protein
LKAFESRLRELGWVEEKNIIFVHRFAQGEGTARMQELAAELVKLKVDVLVARATNGGTTAKQATSTIPIVMVSGGDPVGTGIVKSLAQPGGNITGVNSMSPELITKRLQLLKELVSRLSRVGVLINEHASAGSERQLKELEPAARLSDVKLREIRLKHGSNRFENGFETAVREKLDAIIPVSSPGYFAERKQIVELAAKYRLPAIYPQKEYVEEGGLVSYGVELSDLYRRAAVYVDKILRGAKPADLPIDRPTKFEFVVNLKTAKSLGLTIPPQMLIDADKVIK